MTNVDKVIILSQLSTETLAYYAMAQTIAATMLLVSGAVMRVEGQAMIRRFGETGDPAALHPRLLRVLLVLAYVQPSIVGTIWLLGPAFFATALPKYSASVPLLDLMAVAFYAMGTALGASYLYVALGKQVLNGMLLLAGMVASAALSFALIGAGWGAAGVATASAVSGILYLAAFLVFALRMVGRRGHGLVADLTRILTPFVACVVLLLSLVAAPRLGVDRLWVASFSLLAAGGLAIRGLSLARHAAEPAAC
jgi:O-antigen/teichoic acid export membrane protein